MKIPALKLQNQVSHYLEAALTEPVIIEQTGKPMTVMISYVDYERLLEIEEAFWAQKAIDAEAKGHFLGEKSLDELMRLKERTKMRINRFFSFIRGCILCLWGTFLLMALVQDSVNNHTFIFLHKDSQL